MEIFYFGYDSVGPAVNDSLLESLLHHLLISDFPLLCSLRYGTLSKPKALAEPVLLTVWFSIVIVHRCTELFGDQQNLL